jgi:hypothetical protein
MTLIFKLDSFRFLGSHRASWMNVLLSLNPSLLIRANDMKTFEMKFFGLVVQLADFPDFLHGVGL